jgi:hypothetical protein
LTVALPLIAVAGTLAYGLIVGLLAPAARSAEATLNLTIVAFLAGVPAYTAMTVLPIAAARPRLAATLADRWHLAVIAYA